MAYQAAIDWQTFLTSYWQKRPVVLRQAFTDFIDPISPDELAGLAMEELVESRLVARQQGEWHVARGPFSEYADLGEENWSLLVQAVDHWHPVAAGLIEPFRVLPNWRLDDLMISFSVPGGGVGPHIDQYDVFIIQGMGRRHWRVGDNLPLPQHCPHPALLHVDPFEPIIDVELCPGDILYIPPGFPHDGYAIEASMNYSVGFRAPNQRELFNQFADHLLAEDGGNARYGDPDIQIRHQPGCITQNEVDRLRNLMIEMLKSDDFARQMAQGFSDAKHDLDLEEVDPPFDQEEILERLQEGDHLMRLGGLRCLYIEGEAERCYINGEVLNIPEGGESLMQYLCDHVQADAEVVLAELAQPALVTWLTHLVNVGYWYFASDLELDTEE